jgi:hypothetical protein
MPNTMIRPCECVHCGKTFYGPEEGLGGALIVGEAAQRRAMRYVQTLTTHLQKHHPKVLTTAQIFGSEYAGMLALMNFKTDDELVAQQRDFVRWKVHNATRRASVSDDRIVEKVRSILAGYLMKDPERERKLSESMADGVGSKIVEVMTEMRDVLEERGRYTETPMTPAAAGENPTPEGQTAGK